MNMNNQKNRTFMEPLKYIKEHDDENISEETAYDSYYTQYTTPDSMDCGSDNLLVTFDYGYSDSIGAPNAAADAATVEDEDADADANDYNEAGAGAGAGAEAGEADYALWFGMPQNDAWAFQVYHVQHEELSLQSLISYDVDDFEEQSEPESDQAENEEVFYDSIEG
ncbi:GH14226 [Drosophila grimshawi]|uniref:GH14226 n=2 Tax=Drosophila grimshawi TaxID=7222 RepID=B4JY47_DROGR|nr:GH14226 [Drosophila grimshawi]